MKKFKVSLNGTKLMTIEAKDYDCALHKAVHLYGLEVAVEQITY